MCVRGSFKPVIFNLVMLMLTIGSRSQCLTPINAFPYVEDFEASPGNWNSAGLSDDWAWGTPTKGSINSAGNGVNCWISGGLITSFYNNGERSWVQSPCFDFSSLNHPQISFYIYWETEFRYDGGNLQVSVNGGSTWSNVGAANETPDCNTQNWYNYTSITNLNGLTSNTNGWSGNHFASSGSCVGGNGSLGWVLAKHCLPNLAHQPQVIFRFTFGAGTTCNNYDGIAFDLVTISEASSPLTDFTSTCTSASSISFDDITSSCPDSWQWNFGDGNTSNLQNPTHAYSAGGTYQVTLVSGNSCNGFDSITHPVTVISTSVNSTNETCPGTSDGTATVVVSPNGTYTYAWNTVPLQTSASATGLSAGTYTVDVSSASSCSASASVVITAGSNQPLAAVTNSTPETCAGRNDGSASIVINQPGVYNLNWNTVPPQSSTTISNVGAGTYQASVTGTGLCQPVLFSITVQLIDTQTVQSSFNSTPAYCPDFSNGTASITVLNPGNHIYTWNTIPPQSTQTATSLSEGSYQVNVSGPSLCHTFTQTVQVMRSNVGVPQVQLGSDTSTCPGNKILLDAGVFMSYNWSDGSDSSVLFVDKPGTYWVTVMNNLLCYGSDTIRLEQSCIDDILVPNAFSPNGDLMNEEFRAYGLLVQDFNMKLFNRWGQLIFFSDDMERGWDGNYLGRKAEEGIYTWLIDYSIDGSEPKKKVGSVLLLR